MHPSVLHINFQVKGEASKSTEPAQNIKEVSSNVCRHNGVGNCKCALSIVQTYALLDPASLATFCTERLVQRLILEVKPTTV